jgi:hypothetical protein
LLNMRVGIERERGRGNGSFSGVEVLKPKSFKERSDVRFPSPAQFSKNSNQGFHKTFSSSDQKIIFTKIGLLDPFFV